ncbi:MAG: antibiotic biosynthesis monooxygenase family protein [Bacteroidota bacterium]
MVLEHVLIQVDPAKASAYVKAYSQARYLVEATDGCRSCRLLPSHDEPGQFLLLIEWSTKAHHTEGFRKSPQYLEWSRLLHPFYEVFPTVSYFTCPSELIWQLHEY